MLEVGRVGWGSGVHLQMHLYWITLVRAHVLDATLEVGAVMCTPRAHVLDYVRGWEGWVGQWRSLANAPVLDYVSACTCAGCYVRGWSSNVHSACTCTGLC